MAGRTLLLAGLGLLCLAACASAQANNRQPAPSDELALRLFSNSLENFPVRPAWPAGPCLRRDLSRTACLRHWPLGLPGHLGCCWTFLGPACHRRACMACTSPRACHTCCLGPKHGPQEGLRAWL